MSENQRSDDYYLISGEECSSGRASRRSMYATYTTRHWKNEKYRRVTLYGPAGYDGRMRPVEKRMYKSKWRKRKDRRNFREIPKGFYGYKKEAVKLNWIKHTCSQGGAKNGKEPKEIVMGWRHPTQSYIVWRDSKPKPVTSYRWVSTAKPGNDEWVQRTYPEDKDGNAATAMGLMSKRGRFQYDYVPPPEPVKKKIRMEKP